MISNDEVRKKKRCARVFVGSEGAKKMQEFYIIGKMRGKETHRMTSICIVSTNEKPETIGGITFKEQYLLNVPDGRYAISSEDFHGFATIKSLDETTEYTEAIILPSDESSKKLLEILSPDINDIGLEVGSICSVNGVSGIISDVNYVLLDNKPLLLEKFKYPVFKPNYSPPLCTYGAMQVPPYTVIKSVDELKVIDNDILSAITLTDQSPIKSTDRDSTHIGVITKSPTNTYKPHIFNLKKPSINDTKNIISSIFNSDATNQILNGTSYKKAKSVIDIILNE